MKEKHTQTLHKLFKLFAHKRPSIELVPPKKYLNFSKWLPSANFHSTTCQMSVYVVDNLRQYLWGYHV